MKKLVKKILIIDDEQLMLDALSELFTRCGWLVENANNGENGLKMKSSFNPDVILSDINMPKLDGLELLDILYEEQCLIPVIFLTGYKDSEKIKRAWTACAFEFLEKPIEKDKLLEVCDNALNFGTEYVKNARNRYTKVIKNKTKTA